MATSEGGLFRPEAVDRIRTRLDGAVVVQNLTSTGVIALFSIVLVVGALLVLYFGEYTRRISVKGQLVPANGLSQISSPTIGVVVRRGADTDQHVSAGQLLYRISTERTRTGEVSVQYRITHEAGGRQASLRMELQKVVQLHAEEVSAAERKLDGLRHELAVLVEQAVVQKRRLELAKGTLDRYKALGEGTFFSSSQLQQKEEEVLDQEVRANTIKREQLALQREIAAQTSEVNLQRFRHIAQVEQLKRSISSAEQEVVENEAKREFDVVSPLSGTLVALAAEVGQIVDSQKTIASIVPDGATLVAQIYAPGTSVGLLKVGGRVLMRYQSFPYEVYGAARGTIQSVSTIALAPSEFNSIGGYAGNSGNSTEPSYKVVVALESQTVSSGAERVSLRTGMLLDADLIVETRKLYEWMFAPLFRTPLRG